MADLLGAPWIPVSVAVAAGWYWLGSRRPRLHVLPSARRRRAAPWRGACLAAGLASLVIALDSPLEPLADDYFWAHMLQHVLLLTVTAPLIVLGAPWLPFFRALPLAVRRGIARPVAKSPALAPLRRAAKVAASPLGALLLLQLDLALWHIPALYDATLGTPAVHYAEHLSFLVFAALFWTHLVDSPPFRSRLSPIGRVAYATTASVASWLLAIVLTFARTPLYPIQSAGRHGGLSALADQQLAAGVMLGPGSIPYAIVVFYWLYVWLGSDEPRPRRRSPRRSALESGAR